MRRYAEAVAPLESMLAGNPGAAESARGRATLAICYSRTGKLDKAKQLFREVLDKKRSPTFPPRPPNNWRKPPTRPATWIGPANCTPGWRPTTAPPSRTPKARWAWPGPIQDGPVGRGRRLFDQVLKLNPQPARAAEAALARGQVLEQLGKFDPALAMYDLVIDALSSTSSPYGLAGRGPAALQAAAIRPGGGDFERLATQFPKLPEIDAVLYEWSWALQDSGKQAEADKLRAADSPRIPAQPLLGRRHHRLAQRAVEDGRLAKAATVMDELLAAASRAQDPRAGPVPAGQVAQAQDQWDQVRKSFETLLADFPAKPDAALGRVLGRRGHLSPRRLRRGRQAVRPAGRQVARRRSSPGMAKIPLRRARSSSSGKNGPRPCRWRRKSNPIIPDFEEQYEADYVIGRCLANQADFEAARKAYRQVINVARRAKTETAAMAQWLIGESYFHQKN